MWPSRVHASREGSELLLLGPRCSQMEMRSPALPVPKSLQLHHRHLTQADTGPEEGALSNDMARV